MSELWHMTSSFFQPDSWKLHPNHYFNYCCELTDETTKLAICVSKARFSTHHHTVVMCHNSDIANAAVSYLVSLLFAAPITTLVICMTFLPLVLLCTSGKNFIIQNAQETINS